MSVKKAGNDYMRYYTYSVPVADPLWREPWNGVRAEDAGGPQEASPFERQVGGTHYSDMAIQPALYVYLNDIGAREGEAIGYLSRWRQKGGLEDLLKAIHNIELLIELEMKYGARKACRVEPEESNGV